MKRQTSRLAAVVVGSMLLAVLAPGGVRAAITENMLVSYEFNDDVAAGGTVNATAGTANPSGTLRDNAYVAGGALNLDGLVNGTYGDCLYLGSNSGVRGGSNKTVAAWVKLPGGFVSLTYFMITRVHNGGFNLGSWASDRWAGEWHYTTGYNSAGTTAGAANSPYNTRGNWVHVLSTYNRAGLLTIWVNGVLDNSVAAADYDLTSANANVILGANQNQNASLLPGKLDDWAVWDRVLATNEIEQLSGKDVGGYWGRITPTGAAVPPMAVSSYFPTNGATGVIPAGPDLVATFDRPVFTNTTGTLTITNITAGTVTNIAIADTSLITVNDTELRISSSLLAENTDYAILIATNAIKDAAGTFFAGITNATTWSFSTGLFDTTAPMIGSLSPSNNAGGVAANRDLVIAFNETVKSGLGSITITNLTAGGTVAATVTVVGNTVTIDPDSDFALDTTYAVLIDADAVKDLSGNYFAGILDTVTWRFTTESPALWVYEGFDCSGASGGTSLQGLKGATSAGLDAAGWNVTQSSTQTATYESDTLTFGSGSTELATAPGRALFNSDGTDSYTGYVRADRGLIVAIATPGPDRIFGAYLFKVEKAIPSINRYAPWYFQGDGTTTVRYNMNTAPIGWNSNKGYLGPK